MKAPNSEEAFQILAENTRRSILEKKEYHDFNTPIENIIGEIDPDMFKYHDCHRWLPISKLSPGHEEPHCLDCHPNPYEAMALPLMRRVFHKQLRKIW